MFLYFRQNNYNGRPNYGQDGYQYNENPYYNNDERTRYEDERTRFEDERTRLEEERRWRIEEANLKRLLADVDEQSSNECSINVGAQWNFETNVNEITQQEAVNRQITLSCLE